MNIGYVMISLGAVKKAFSRLGQKVNKNIDAYGHDADGSGTDLCPCLPARHLDTVQYCNRI